MPPFAFGPAINGGYRNGCCCAGTFDSYPYYPSSYSPPTITGPCQCCASDAKVILITSAVDEPIMGGPYPDADCATLYPAGAFGIKWTFAVGVAVRCYPSFISQCSGGSQFSIYEGFAIVNLPVKKFWNDPIAGACPDCAITLRLRGRVTCNSTWDYESNTGKFALSGAILGYDVITGPGSGTTCNVLDNASNPGPVSVTCDDFDGDPKPCNACTVSGLDSQPPAITWGIKGLTVI